MKRNCFKTPVKRAFALSCLSAFVLLFLLSSCDNQDVPDNRKPEIPTGERVAVKITVGGLGFEDNEVNTRSARTTEEEPPVSLRGDTIPLNQGIIVRVVVYTGQYTGYTDYTGHADYEVTVGGLLTPYPVGGSELWVPMGASCKFVAYSFNETTAMDPYSATTAPFTDRDVLWGDTIETVSLGASDVHITMQHLMAKVVVRGKADYLYSLNSVDAGILCYEPTLTVNTGVLSQNNLTYKPVPWTFGNPSDSIQVSDTMYVFTDAAATTSLIINQLSVNSVLFTGPFYVNYAKPLEAGNKYTLHVRFSPQPVGGSAARITWEPPVSPNTVGRYVITYDPRDAGLYFKYGSVAGIFSAAGQNQTLNTSPIPAVPAFALSDVAWCPSIVTDWAGIPGVANGVIVTIDAVFHNEVNVKAGLGDPCRLVDLNLAYIAATSAGSLTRDDIDNGVWRLPTPQENIDFSGGIQGIISLSPGDWWWNANAIGNISFGVAGGEFPKINTGGMSKFLPAAGSRYNVSGAVQNQGIWGTYLSNEAIIDTYSTVGPDLLDFSNTQLRNNLTKSAQYGYSVRCVKQALEFEIEVNAWEPGGTMSEDIILP